MRHQFIAAALAATMLSAPAHAQNEAPFTGPRAEVVVGYDEGVVYGGAIGYDFQIGGAVAGFEAELTDSTAEACDDLITATSAQICERGGRDIYAGARIGAALGPDTLLYAKAGYTNLRYQTVHELGGASDFTTTEYLDGARIGAGIERKLGGNTYVKAEYRYSDYEGGASKHEGVAGLGFRF